MPELRPGTPAQEAFLAELVAAGLLIPSGVPGLYGRAGAFEDIRLALDRTITASAAADAPEAMRFPPLLPRRHLEASGYLQSFPHLAGTVFAFEGGEAEAIEQLARASRHEPWPEHQSMTDLVLTPAACYPVYPAIASRGALAAGGVCVDAGGAYVFRHEPSGDPARLQMFHQREIVRLGEPDTVAAWRDGWRERALTMLTRLALDAEAVVASDPFFGRGGRILAANQRAQALKFEIQVPIAGDEPTAVASFNYHGDHFAAVYGIVMEGGRMAHTACLGFGLERITLALLRAHGLDSGQWPGDIRRELWPA